MDNYSIAVNEIQKHVATVVEKMLKSAFDWAERRLYFGKIEDITSDQLAILCHLYELMGSNTTKESLSHVISMLAQKSGHDAPSWLERHFKFKEEEIDNFITACNAQDLNRFFNPIDLNNKYELIFKAVSNENCEMIDKLIRNGVDVNSEDKEGATALHIAAGEDNKKMVQFLLEKGASCYALDSRQEVPFDKALQCRYSYSEEFPTADFLLPYVFANKVIPGGANTRLHQAAYEGDALRLRYLLQKVDDPDVLNIDGYTALHIGASRGYPDVVKVLIEYGADVNLVCTVKSNEENQTPLKLAQDKNHNEDVMILKAVGGLL